MSELPVFAPNLLSGKLALITGGGTGIGFATARELGSLGARGRLSRFASGRVHHGLYS